VHAYWFTLSALCVWRITHSLQAEEGVAASRPSSGRFPMGRAYFEYIGPTAMIAVGSVTGRQYRFPTRGVPVVVDARDRWSLARVPNLREVR
jgi:hypothetical protein